MGKSKTLVKTCRYNLSHNIPSKSLPSWQDAKQQMNFIRKTITQHEEQCQSIFISLPFILSSGGTMLFNHSCKNSTVINLSVANAPAYQSYVQNLKLNPFVKQVYKCTISVSFNISLSCSLSFGWTMMTNHSCERMSLRKLVHNKSKNGENTKLI